MYAIYGITKMTWLTPQEQVIVSKIRFTDLKIQLRHKTPFSQGALTLVITPVQIHLWEKVNPLTYPLYQWFDFNYTSNIVQGNDELQSVGPPTVFSV